MRMSRLFSQTLRESPGEAEAANYQLLLRAGYIRQLAAGIFCYLPLARRSMTHIETIMREEMNAIGGQEVTMPVVHPADVWKETGRWYQIGSEMGRFKDKNDHDMVLAMTHEEVVSDLVRNEIRSYRQLPALIYHIQTKWRDDPRPRGGLVRVREFTMLDSYSLDASWEGLDAQYQAHYQAYFNIFQRCGLPVRAVKADTGMMGGKLAHEFMYLNPIGEDSLLFCEHCDYSANRQVAQFAPPIILEEAFLPVKKVATPHTSTIEDLANLLEIPTSHTAKAVFFVGTYSTGSESIERFIFGVVRGDMEINEYKLANALGKLGFGPVTGLRPAVNDEIQSAGAVPGYASPIGLKPAARGSLTRLVVVDELVPHCFNLAAGANEEGYHLLNSNYGRDYVADLVTDIASAGEGFGCPECGHPMLTSRGVEVGNIFQLGDRYSQAMGCSFLDEKGESLPVLMGSYGIGVGRLLACIAEEHHDEQGLCWPASVAPYPVHLVSLAGRNPLVGETAGKLYSDLIAAGLEPLFDDREESAGVKFMDADLIGLPLRLTVSDRALKQGGIEMKLRDQPERTIIPLEEIISKARSVIDNF
jgi:prolyl-tRNA synthetase